MLILSLGVFAHLRAGSSNTLMAILALLCQGVNMEPGHLHQPYNHTPMPKPIALIHGMMMVTTSSPGRTQGLPRPLKCTASPEKGFYQGGCLFIPTVETANHGMKGTRPGRQTHSRRRNLDWQGIQRKMIDGIASLKGEWDLAPKRPLPLPPDKTHTHINIDKYIYIYTHPCTHGIGVKYKISGKLKQRCGLPLQGH